MIPESNLYRNFDRDPLTAEAVLRYFAQHERLDTPITDAYITYIERIDPDFRGRLLMHLVDYPFDLATLKRLVALYGEDTHFDAYCQVLLTLIPSSEADRLAKESTLNAELAALLDRRREVEEAPLEPILTAFVKLAADPKEREKHKRHFHEIMSLLEIKKAEVTPWLERQLEGMMGAEERLPIHEVFCEMAPRFDLSNHLSYLFDAFDEEPSFYATLLGAYHDDRIQAYLKATMPMSSGDGLFFRMMLAAGYRDLEGTVYQSAKHRLEGEKKEAVFLELLRNFHSGAYGRLMTRWQGEVPNGVIPLVIPYLSLTEEDEALRSELVEKHLERGRERKKWLASVEEEAKADVGPNDPCPCGSGKKYKKCCMNRSRS